MIELDEACLTPDRNGYCHQTPMQIICSALEEQIGMPQPPPDAIELIQLTAKFFAGLVQTDEDSLWYLLKE